MVQGGPQRLQILNPKTSGERDDTGKVQRDVWDLTSFMLRMPSLFLDPPRSFYFIHSLSQILYIWFNVSRQILVVYVNVCHIYVPRKVRRGCQIWSYRWSWAPWWSAPRKTHVLCKTVLALTLAHWDISPAPWFNFEIILQKINSVITVTNYRNRRFIFI